MHACAMPSHVILLQLEIFSSGQDPIVVEHTIIGEEVSLIIARFELLVWPHEVEPWFHSWFRDRADAKYLGSSLLTHEVEPWLHSWYRGRVETLH